MSDSGCSTLAATMAETLRERLSKIEPPQTIASLDDALSRDDKETVAKFLIFTPTLHPFKSRIAHSNYTDDFVAACESVKDCLLYYAESLPSERIVKAVEIAYMAVKALSESSRKTTVSNDGYTETEITVSLPAQIAGTILSIVCAAIDAGISVAERRQRQVPILKVLLYLYSIGLVTSEDLTRWTTDHANEIDPFS